MTLPTAQILALCDAGQPPSAIAARLDLPLGPVYAILRQERPQRPRAARRRTSTIPAQVAALAAAGIGAARVASLLGISRAYVYRLLARAT